ncbi:MULTISPECIES: M23 family metallopeptidase [unclassified Lysobacter]|uniref:M23 family metallopeptidase n=1 Tax=unclassified Lysobacter TaxID=2635362 RepID=UPI001F569DCC|nr:MULTISPECIES: M23 family metallopeptidase [unclassified Lysobacter]
MLKGLLLFIAGVLVGANVVYFLMTRHDRGGVGAPAVATTSTVRASADGNVAAPLEPDRSGEPHGPTTPSPAPPAAPVSSAPPVAAPSATPPGTALLMPVRGVRPEQLGDTYNQTRGGTRIHEALDIMAPRGTPVVAAVDGKVEKLFTSDAGGLTVYQFDPSATYAYYYAHLDSYAPGLHEGMQLRRGDVIGTVGSTGNASPDGPHLHFAIFLLGPEKQWWKGTPVNPYPLLRGG